MFVDTSKQHDTEEIGIVPLEKVGETASEFETGKPVDAVDLATESTDVVSGGVQNLNSVFLDWAKETGFEVNAEALPEIKDEAALKGLVSKTYAVEYAKGIDPMLSDLLEKGISYQDYQEQIKPLQDIVNQGAEGLYTYMKYEQEVNELIRLGRLGENSTEEEFAAIWDGILAQTQAKMEGLSDNEKESLVSDVRNKYNQDLHGLTNGWKDKQQEVSNKQRVAYETNYENELEALMGEVDTLYRDKKTTNLFGHPEQETFKSFLKEQLGISDIEIELNGEKSKQRGIPFMHRLSTDNQYLLKVMSTMFQVESGKVADIVNEKVGQVIAPLRLTPLSKGTMKAPESTRKFVDTSKKH